MDFAERLAALMAERGLGVRQVAARVPCDPGHISHLIHRKKHPSERMAKNLDQILQAGGELAKLAAPLPLPGLPLPGLAPDQDLYDRITRAIRHPGRADDAAVGWLERCLAEHRRIEDTLGSGPLLGVTREQIRAVAGLAREAPAGLRDRLVSLAAQYAQFMAWLCMDSHDQPSALAWYDRAHGWAAEAGDPDMAATTLSMTAHQAWSEGDPVRCVRLAEAARWYDARVTPGVRGMAAQMAARGHALAGDGNAARSGLAVAEELIRQAAGQPDREPPWMYFYGETWFTLQRGMAELHLASWRRAADLITAGLSGLAPEYRRDRAWYAACLARALAEAGDGELATAVGLDHAGDIAAVNSYARGELNRAAAVLIARGVTSGRTVTEALAEASRSRSKAIARATATGAGVSTGCGTGEPVSPGRRRFP